MMMTKSLKNTQGGLTLIELMVGLAVGMVVVIVAGVGLLASRGISGTVSDASGIQQQAAYAVRTIGMQLRQAGSRYLNLDAQDGVPANEIIGVVGFESGPTDTSSFDPKTQTISGTGNSISVGYRRYSETVVDGMAYLMADCLGGPTGVEEGAISAFTFNSGANTLQCNGQVMLQNVAAFQVRYLLQNNATAGNSTIRYLSAITNTADWKKLQAVEVCLELYGNESIDMPADSSYTGCNGAAIDMTSLPGVRANRMHITYRNVFQLRTLEL
ncbi:MAG: prepilin-type N-terminal cleavage/methylation domain-containing protein [Betaproteobacteria bacterium]|nr:prepilin-type N-terminal cleavage/methylation domain-containing protein [Betaproteobacteria bacterium]